MEIRMEIQNAMLPKAGIRVSSDAPTQAMKIAEIFRCPSNLRLRMQLIQILWSQMPNRPQKYLTMIEKKYATLNFH